MMHLDEAAVRAVLTWDLLIPAMESALSDFSAGRVIQPVRSMITVEEGRRYLGVMPAAAENAMGLKLVSFYPGNRGTVHPTHLAMILLLDPATGQPLRPHGRAADYRDANGGRVRRGHEAAGLSASRVLALLGSGVQAKAPWTRSPRSGASTR
jgi:ornithine cyclodeaminase/alanine dehydrogenase-like protein (mu-crystallin family)